jgi:hypothetical protein
MGYIQYWKPTRAFTPPQFEDLRLAVRRITDVAAQAPWSIGIKLQRLDLGNIWLNGAPLGDEDEDDFTHETFCLNPTNSSLQFCKTDRKPYGAVVVACLLAAETIALDNGFSMGLSSDGDDDEFQDGCALYEACFPGRLGNYRIRVGDRTVKQNLILWLEVGYCGPQSVPTASLEQDPEDPDALGTGDVPVPDSLRVWWIHSMASNETYYESVSSLEEGRRVLSTLANFGKFLLGTFNSHGGLQEFMGLDGEFDEDEPGDTQGWIDVTDRIAPF